ncbi:MAG: hypothetical protein NUV69_00790 [Candidatus Curtissbacteria bacterium]|nr:hypothetical protein [Candidatus Curtissbacteria bacterium]
MDKVTLLSLSMDLKRITTSIQRGSKDNAKRFSEEAERWTKELGKTDDQYLKKLIKKINATLEAKNDLKKAEDCLMYSVLTQNKALYSSK